MTFFRTDRHSQIGLIMLVLMALVFAPLASAGIADLAAAEANSNHTEACGEMHDADVAASQQANTSECCDQNTDCQTHCQNLVLSHLPVSALLGTVTFQHRATGFISSLSLQMLAGITAALDPRPPRA